MKKNISGLSYSAVNIIYSNRIKGTKLVLSYTIKIQDILKREALKKNSQSSDIPKNPVPTKLRTPFMIFKNLKKKLMCFSRLFHVSEGVYQFKSIFEEDKISDNKVRTLVQFGIVQN